tara:strand:- start:603 stop:716 length:114 start_codon:yes stop_codon:yes gene_type:complete
MNEREIKKEKSEIVESLKRIMNQIVIVVRRLEKIINH